MHQDFIVSQWSVWPPQENSRESEKSLQAEILSVIPRMLKRRLSPLAKIVFCAASQSMGDNHQIATVFSSTHGELAKSFKMMQLIECGEEISPTTFSLSVHNAIAGLLSIIYKNNAQSTVVAPGEEGIACAFIEAIGLLQEGESEVLMILYDEPLVSFYPSAPYQLTSEHSCAIALRISKTGKGQSLQFSSKQLTGYGGEQPIQIPLLMRFLSGSEQSLTIQTPSHSWCWEKK